MGCCVNSLRKYLEPKPRNEEKNFSKDYEEKELGQSEHFKLKNKKTIVIEKNKIKEKEKSLNEREKLLEEKEKKLLNNQKLFEEEKKNYEEEKAKENKSFNELKLEKDTLLKNKVENDEKEKELQNMKEEINKEKDELEKKKKEIQDKENELKAKEQQMKNELMSSTNIFENKNIELNKKEQELNEKENQIKERENQLNKKEQELIEKYKDINKNRKEPILIGLNNIGATCYMNASLQCLSNTKKLTEYFLNHYKKDSNKIMSNEYYEVLQNLWNKENNNKSYSPNSFKDILGKENPLFAGIAANDSKDLINFLIERFHQELNIVNSENNINNNNPNENQPDQTNEQLILKLFIDEFKQKFNSPISNLMYGILETKSQCQGCNIIKFNFQVYSFLEFPLQEINKFFFNKGKRALLTEDGKNPDVDLYECFEYNAKTDLMTGDNQMYCNQCNKLCDAFYTTILYSSPIYLVINLNRGKGAVYECKVNFPEQLSIINYITNKNGYTAYELYAVICHLGPSSMSGHFVAYCRNRIDNKWYLYNDATVTLCTRKDQYTDGMPYILFYKALKAGDDSFC